MPPERVLCAVLLAFIHSACRVGHIDIDLSFG